ncbi:MAG: carboxypeptidase-like regulatory domain-containing protein, partial [Candidatus Aminicenantes bacterium]|nr:carboxypeptidase-like regulatory domain-containing protein [Candidatus Aminicenantes bacterium]
MTDRAAHTPLAGCRVSVLESVPALAAATNAEGRYRIDNVPAGAWQV